MHVTAVALTRAVSRKLGSINRARRVGFAVALNGMQASPPGRPLWSSSIVTRLVGLRRSLVSGLRFADVAVQALLSALLVFRLLPRGFCKRELREHLAALLGETPSALTQGRMTYQLRRLRLHGLIVRQAGTHRYGVTNHGLRVALFFTRSYARILRPGLSQVGAENLPDDPPLRRAFAQLEHAMDQYVAQAKLTSES